MESHPPPRDESEEPNPKRQKVDTDDDDTMGFGFNNPIYSNHRIVVSTKGNTEEETIHVAKLVCCAHSKFFKERMTKEDETCIELEEGQQITHFVDLLRWMYVHKFQNKGPDLSVVMAIAHKYKVDKALKQCAKELSADMNIQNACAYLDQEVQMRTNDPSAEIFEGFSILWQDAKLFIQKTFSELTLKVMFSSSEFFNLSVEGMKAILQCENLRIGTENTLFVAFRQWIHYDFENRKQSAAQLLPLLRFTQFYKDFLLDVVKKEGELSYPEDAKKVFAQKIIDAYMYHCTTPERRQTLNQSWEAPRTYDESLLKETFYWKIDQVSNVKETWSDAFFLGGYMLHLLAQRKNSEKENGGTLGLYMHIKVDQLGKDWYVPLAFEISVKNQQTGRFVSLKGSYPAPFTYGNRAWGYVDILGVSWDSMCKDSCPYTKNGSLEVKADVWFKEYWEKTEKKEAGTRS